MLQHDREIFLPTGRLAYQKEKNKFRWVKTSILVKDTECLNLSNTQVIGLYVMFSF